MGHVSSDIQIIAIKSNLISTSGRNSMQSKGDLFYDDHILSGERRKL